MTAVKSKLNSTKFINLEAFEENDHITKEQLITSLIGNDIHEENDRKPSFIDIKSPDRYYFRLIISSICHIHLIINRCLIMICIGLIKQR